MLRTAALPLLFLLATAGLRGQSALDGFDPNANGAIRAVVVQPDGKILIGGLFTTLSPNGGVAVTRNHIARLNPDGTLDTAFNPNANNDVYSIAVQADGKILVAGVFNGANSIGGQTRNFIARLDATTGLADSFNPNANDSIISIAVQADGRILAGGGFTTIGGQTRNYIARLDATTGLADSFDPNANSLVYALAVQADGKILAGGDFSGANSIGGQMRNHIARLDATTGLADSFDPNANSFVYALAVQADGKILVGGVFNGANSIGGQTRNHIARLGAATGLADSFDSNASSTVSSIAVQADGKVLAAGGFTSIGGQTRNRIARLDAATGLADSFDPNADGFVYAIAVQTDGKILAGGNFTTVTPAGGAAVTRNRIARLETDGRLDQTLNLGPGNFADFNNYLTAVQPDGKILIGGNFTSVSGVSRNHIARVNTDGTLDMAFNPNASSHLTSIAVQADGKILVAGYFSGPNSIGGQARNYIARLDATIGLADSFNPNPDAFVGSIEVQKDGKVLICGDFSAVGGQTRNHIARLDATTGLADSFNPNADAFVYSATSQADGKILAGGFFTSIGGQMRNHIARLDATTGLADSFNPNANDFVNSITVQPDGKILASGNFHGSNSIGGQTRNYIARLDPVTGLADLFNPAPNSLVNTTAIQSNGKILVGGGFNQIGGQFRPAIARLDAATGAADSFDPNATNSVATIALQADGKILAGGSFFSIGGQTRNAFARLSNDTAALQDLSVTRTTIVWTRSGSSPQFTRVTFEYSTDNLTYIFLGYGTAGDTNWSLTELNLPGGSFYVRARGYYRTGGQNRSQSLVELVRNAFLSGPITTPTPSVPPTTLGNISTRLRVEMDDNVLIGGFIVTGTQSKRIIVRAIGPSLSSFFAGTLVDPVLELRDSSGGLIRSNDNWRSDQEPEIIATTIPPSNDLESAIVETLPANGSAYTAIVRGVDNGTGVGLIEAYDLDPTVNSKLANISTRGLVQTGNDVMIAGTIVLGQASQRVLVRALGPSLPVQGNLADPTLELRDGNGTLIRANDNWRSDQESEIIATTIPPSDDLESAIVATLPANGAAYTAIVSGTGGSIGVAIAEVYALN